MALLLTKYASLGIIPLIVPSILIDVQIPTNSIQAQRGTDFAYIKALADRVGYVFYLEPGPAPGVNKAYWGPQIKLGVPQPSLNLNMDAHSNVEQLSFSFDNQKNKIPTVFIYDELTKVIIAIPIPPITPLNPPLGLISPLPTSIGDLKPVDNSLSKRSIPQAIMIGLAKAAQWAEAVTGEGSLDVIRYGRLLKARQLVGVRGGDLAVGFEVEGVDQVEIADVGRGRLVGDIDGVLEGQVPDREGLELGVARAKPRRYS